MLETLQEKAFLNKGVRINYKDEACRIRLSLIVIKMVCRVTLDYLLEENKVKPIADEKFYFEREDGIRVEVAFAWTELTSIKIKSYVNGIHTAEGGSHEDGFRSGLGKAVRNYISVHNLLPKGIKVTTDDIREGMIAVISVNVPGAVSQLQFQGQTKDKLNNPEVSPPVDNLLKSFENALNGKPKNCRGYSRKNLTCL